MHFTENLYRIFRHRFPYLAFLQKVLGFFNEANDLIRILEVDVMNLLVVRFQILARLHLAANVTVTRHRHRRLSNLLERIPGEDRQPRQSQKSCEHLYRTLSSLESNDLNPKRFACTPLRSYSYFVVSSGILSLFISTLFHDVDQPKELELIFPV